MLSYDFESFVVPRFDHPQVQPADFTVKGTAPFRAAAFCEPFRMAAAQGWLIFPPCDFMLRWTGDEFQWLHAGASSWTSASKIPLGRVGKMSGEFDCPVEEAAALPAITALPEPGYVQLWTGLTCRSPSGWWTNIKSVTNFAAPTAYDVLEGVTETDWWHGPILLNMRFRRTGEPVSFRKSHPIATIQPVHRAEYSSEFRHKVSTPKDGANLIEALSVRDSAHPGGYARETRRRKRAANKTEGDK